MPEKVMTEMIDHTAKDTQTELTQRERTRDQIKELQQRLREKEAKDVSGAASLTPKQVMLDQREIAELNPDYHYRLVNTTDPNKAKIRRRQGYVPVSDEEATAAGVDNAIGTELRMMKIPREKHDKRVREIDELHKNRLAAHKTEVQSAAESIVRELKDKHGLDVPLDRLLVDE